MIIRIVGYERGILKIHHTKYLKDVVGLRLFDAKTLTDDILAGKVREIEVPDEHAAIHAGALRVIGAVVELGEARKAA